ncbi:hypothetical protein ElyMa_004368800 [Elysia marginata]|uniref:FAS1 domain-containing protein n=1 Tax=Elysia marginata TaxID=1093978 RepID=A0AAV4H6D6_9GAST|nr:hypothetical protein ElyMa_004368800 [Elysia marginata]
MRRGWESNARLPDHKCDALTTDRATLLHSIFCFHTIQSMIRLTVCIILTFFLFYRSTLRLFLAQDSHPTKADLQASNGTIHVINSYLPRPNSQHPFHLDVRQGSQQSGILCL